MQETPPASGPALIGQAEAPQAPGITIWKLALAGVCALAALAAAPNANATVVSSGTTYTWTSGFADTGNVGGSNGISFSGSFNYNAKANPSDRVNDEFTAKLNGLGTLYTTNDYLMICETGNDTGTDSIQVTFAFTSPGTGSGTLTGTGSVSDVTVNGHINRLTGAITWNNPDIIVFGNEEVSISLDNVS